MEHVVPMARNSLSGCFESQGIGTTPTETGWHHQGSLMLSQPGNTFYSKPGICSVRIGTELQKKIPTIKTSMHVCAISILKVMLIW